VNKDEYIGCARRAVHAGSFIAIYIIADIFAVGPRRTLRGEQGAPLQSLHTIPLQPCYATAVYSPQ